MLEGPVGVRGTGLIAELTQGSVPSWDVALLRGGAWRGKRNASPGSCLICEL
jgi:hypothetical protein